MKQIFISFLAIKTGFICFFRSKANQQIFTCETNKNGSEFSCLSKYLIYFASKKIYVNEANIFKKNQIFIEAKDL
jgi:hypothetical protein